MSSGAISSSPTCAVHGPGHSATQFLPSTYRRLAVDFDKDGRRDLVHSVPDALASTANFLRKAGWTAGQSWGYEVRVPANYRGPSGRTRRAPVSGYGKFGVTRIDGAPLTGNARAGLILPSGPKGPAFLVFGNFAALYSYNNAEFYALAISHLSDRLKGGAALATAWPTDDPGLSRRQRREVQKLLIARGYDIGEADGRIGPVTQGDQAGPAGTRDETERTAEQYLYKALGGQ